MRCFSEAVRPLIPVAICMLLGSLWVLRSPNNIIEVDPRAMYFMTGTIFSNICVSRLLFQMNLFDILIFCFSVIIVPINSGSNEQHKMWMVQLVTDSIGHCGWTFTFTCQCYNRVDDTLRHVCPDHHCSCTLWNGCCKYYTIIMLQ